VKYPWNLTVGEYSWIGEGAWLDSLAPITIGSNVCISQGVYF
jgi:putative colanic acid biosynthesis acetyltransferase WcaF